MLPQDRIDGMSGPASVQAFPDLRGPFPKQTANATVALCVRHRIMGVVQSEPIGFD